MNKIHMIPIIALALLAGCNRTDAADPAPLLLTGNSETQWHEMRPVERGWVGGQVITGAMGPYGNPNNIQILEMRAAVAPGTDLVGVCGLLKNRDEVGLFVAVYHPDTLTTTGEAAYRLQDNIMAGRDIMTDSMTISKATEAVLIQDCRTFGIAGE